MDIPVRFVSQARAAKTLRPADFLRRLVVAGLLVAIVAVGVIALLDNLRISRDCARAFSRGFSDGFDRYHCELVIRLTSGYQIKIPLP
jgi:hypothetical protein